MKITVDLDCTPEEARAFLGFPDVKPMQDALMRDIEEHMRSSLKATQPDELLKLWLPANPQGYQAMLDAFLRMGGAKRD